MFHALMQSDPSKKGIVGLLTGIRGMRGESTGVNLFVRGAIEDVGRIVASIEEARRTPSLEINEAPAPSPGGRGRRGHAEEPPLCSGGLDELRDSTPSIARTTRANIENSHCPAARKPLTRTFVV